MTKPFDPEPRQLCPDPQMGTREGWAWCAECCGIQAPGHAHGLALLLGALPILDEDEIERLWLAESLLCALAFDHERSRNDGLVVCWSKCLFCEAAR